MAENLRYDLVPNTTALGSRNNNSIFEFNTGDYIANESNTYIMSYNTQAPASNGEYYYTWYAATAGIGNVASVNVDIDGSICPAHWKLPFNYTYSKNKSWSGLLVAYGVSATNKVSSATTQDKNILNNAPFSLALRGRFIAGVLGYDGMASHYWTSTTGPRQSADGTGQAYPYVFYYQPPSNELQPQNLVLGGRVGRQVRCVAL